MLMVSNFPGLILFILYILCIPLQLLLNTRRERKRERAMFSVNSLSNAMYETIYPKPMSYSVCLM
jgi:hypothetical protein